MSRSCWKWLVLLARLFRCLVNVVINKTCCSARECVWPKPGGGSLQTVVGQPGGLSHLRTSYARGRSRPHGHRDGHYAKLQLLSEGLLWGEHHLHTYGDREIPSSTCGGWRSSARTTALWMISSSTIPTSSYRGTFTIFTSITGTPGWVRVESQQWRRYKNCHVQWLQERHQIRGEVEDSSQW